MRKVLWGTQAALEKWFFSASMAVVLDGTLFVEGVAIPAIVEFPHVVLEALSDFGDLFSCEPQRRRFAEYLTGLWAARMKNASAIHREFSNAKDRPLTN